MFHVARVKSSKNDTPNQIRNMAYRPPVTPASDPDTLVALVEEQGLVLRMGQVRRLDAAGLSTEQIAVELSKSSDEWTHELVLKLMGKDGSSTAESYRQKYDRVAAELANFSLVDPEGMLQQAQVHALSVINTGLTQRRVKCLNPECGWTFNDAVTKDQMDMALKVLKASGTGNADTATREVRIPEEDRALLKQFIDTYKPPDKMSLVRLLEEQQGGRSKPN